MLEEEPKIEEAKVIVLRSGKKLKGREEKSKQSPSNVKQYGVSNPQENNFENKNLELENEFYIKNENKGG